MSGDSFHAKAVLLAGQLKAENTQVVTTYAVLLEIGNALAEQRHRQIATNLLAGLELDPTVEIIPFSRDIYERAFQLYKARPDKDWGLVDCISFVVMQDNGVTEALTADQHFQQAGFQTLL